MCLTQLDTYFQSPMKRQIGLIQLTSLLIGIFFGLDQISVIRDLAQLINENNLINYSLITLFFFVLLNVGSWIVGRLLKFSPHFRIHHNATIAKVCGRIFTWALTSMAARHLLLYARFKLASDAYMFFLSLCVIATFVIEGLSRKVESNDRQ